MKLSSQPVLVDIPEQPPQQKQAEPKGQPKLRTVDRQQTTMVTICVEDLIPADHESLYAKRPRAAPKEVQWI